VLRATAELLEEVGYLRLTVAAIAERAGTNKPAIYRRWPTKAHLVHNAVFPVDPQITAVPSTEGLRGDIRALVAVGLDILGRPAARAALPGLLAEMNDDQALHADVLARFATASWGWLEERIETAIKAGEVGQQVEATTVLEIIAGSTFVATAIRPPEALNPAWVERIVDIIMGGIAT
jgi:AcrR family transcriptional regulator